MTILLKLILMLYPDDWRERYEDEFRAMLELCSLSLFDWLDMFITALETRTGYTWREIMKDLLNRLTGLIALLSAFGIISVFAIPDEKTAEFMLIISPILSVLLIPAMHRILKIHRPKTSLLVMMTGIGAILLLIGNFALGITASIMGVQEHYSVLISVISTLSLILIGVWLISVNTLAAKTGTLHPFLAFIGGMAGLAWIIVMLSVMLPTFTDFVLTANKQIYGLYLTSLFMLFLSYFIWAIGTGFYFALGMVSRKLQLAY